MNFTYCDVNTREKTTDINLLFPGFGKDEVLVVMSPHDDDAIIGAGYAMVAAKAAGADVYVMIFCRGDAGYSTLEEKTDIEAVRCRETADCYGRLGIPADHIIRMNYPDFSAIHHWGWSLADGTRGDMSVIMQFMRDCKVTRVMIPNHYHEHIDHTAAHLMASYDVPQAGDEVLVDYGTPFAVRSTLEYSVWADLDPEDALVHGRPSDLRANRILVVSKDVEDKVMDAITAYSSQVKIIEGLVASRMARKTGKGDFVEIYISFDCRPKLNFAPYIKWVDELL